jgi:predicted deacylase
MLPWTDYVAQLRRRVPAALLREYGAVTYDRVRFPLLTVAQPGARGCLILTAGIHGDESAGPLTLLRYLPWLLRHARHHQVGLRVYPCVNPSGWEQEERGNREGYDRNTNTLMQYDVNGVLRGELPPGLTNISYRVDKRVLMPEMRLLFEDLIEQHPPAVPWAQCGFLDLHQDGEILGPRCYAYVFGDRTCYQRLMRACRQLQPPVPPAARLDISQQVDSAPVREPIRTDARGLCETHDGSLSDYLDRQGVRLNATLEVTIEGTSQAHADSVYLTWMLGFLHLLGTRTTD